MIKFSAWAACIFDKGDEAGAASCFALVNAGVPVARTREATDAARNAASLVPFPARRFRREARGSGGSGRRTPDHAMLPEIDAGGQARNALRPDMVIPDRYFAVHANSAT